MQTITMDTCNGTNMVDAAGCTSKDGHLGEGDPPTLKLVHLECIERGKPTRGSQPRIMQRIDPVCQ